MKKIAVVLSGCGVHDGSEIQEAVITLLEIRKHGGEYFCFAPDKDQHHVIDHTTGEEMPGSRNMMVEAARIARGEITALSALKVEDFDGIVFPGGAGAAKNLSKWGLEGPAGEIDEDVKRVINEAIEASVPLALICMSPVLVSKALEGTGKKARITVGTTEAASPYDITAIHEGMQSLGAEAALCHVSEYIEDENYKILTTPAYMMDVPIEKVAKGICHTLHKLLSY